MIVHAEYVLMYTHAELEVIVGSDVAIAVVQMPPTQSFSGMPHL